MPRPTATSIHTSRVSLTGTSSAAMRSPRAVPGTCDAASAPLPPRSGSDDRIDDVDCSTSVSEHMNERCRADPVQVDELGREGDQEREVRRR